MSVRVMSAIWDIPMPPTEKLVLLALADAANDEGHCWPSISTIARKSGVSERSVQRSIRLAEQSGLVEREEVIGKGCKYRLRPRQTVTPDTVAPATETTPTPDTVAPKPSRTIIPKKGKPSLERARRKPAHRLPPEWEPEPFQPGSVSFDIVAPWPAGRIERELSKFRDHWAAASGQKARKHDWQAAWRTWIGNADEFGSRNGARTNGLGRHQPSDGLSATTRAAIAVFGSSRAGLG